MARKPKNAAKAEMLATGSTLVGPAFVMPDRGRRGMALAAEPPVDFQARQDSISPTRRGPDGKLAPKVKRTTAEPAAARETKVKL